MIKVYPFPHQLSKNPYLDQLYEPMQGMGIEICRLRSRQILFALLFGRGKQILHLHFFDQIIQHPNKFQTIARSLIFLSILALLQLRKVKLVWTAHNLQPHENYHSFWAFIVYHTVARWSSAIIAHSEAAKSLLMTRYGPHCQVIPIWHGNYIDWYGPCREQTQSRVALGLPKQGKVFLYLGMLRPYKNLEGLIKTFQCLAVDKRGILLIAGAENSPNYAKELQKLAQNVTGVWLKPHFVPDGELPTYLAAADVVVLPHRSLLTSATLLVALSYARPVVAPAFGPICEIVNEGKEGFLFTPNDDNSLFTALERAFAAPNLAEMNKLALEKARIFDWPTIAAKTIACYQQVWQ